MSTAERRDQLLNLLHRGGTTIPAVAEELGVSERTAYRDLSALRDAGHDIHATPGRGGGVRISPDSRPRPVQFKLAEIIGLTLSIAILKASVHMPFARSAESALDRARRALSADQQRALRRVQRRILIGKQASEVTKTTLGSIEDSLLAVFERCFTGGLGMTFDYVDRKGAPSSRRIECVALVFNAPAWYIVAWDLDKQAPRTFRMDRIRGAVVGEPLRERHPLAQVKAITCPGAEEAYAEWIGTPIG